MSEGTVKILELIMDTIAFKTSVTATVAALFSWAIYNIKSTHKKINNAATKDQLDKVKDDSFKYTDDRMKIHEDKQYIEIESLKKSIIDTHRMVSELYVFHLKK